MVARFALCICLALSASACVIGRSARPSLNEAAQGPLAAPVTGSPVMPQSAPENGDAPPGQGRPGATWISGYWHWDGIRYVWQRGHWQSDSATAKVPPAR